MSETDPHPQPQSTTSRWIVPAVCWAYIFLVIGGVIVFRSRLAMPIDAVTEMSPKRATFFAANAATLTGFQTSVTVESLRPTGQITAFVLVLAGAALSWIVGGILVSRALRLAISEMQIVATSAVLVLLAALIGVIALPGGGVMASIFDSISALTNSGLWIGPRPSMNRAVTGYLLIPLAVVGGVGITVIVELWRSPFTRAISQHARTTLVLLAFVYLIGGAARQRQHGQ